MCKAITFEQIQKANETIRTTDIKGKDYAEVNQRIKAFRMVFPNGQIITEILKLENGIVTMKASVFDDEGNVLGTGHAQEKESSSFINKTSFIENCETSAVGRALGLCGFGIDTSVASYEEVANAINNQNKKADEGELPFVPPSPRERLIAKLQEKNIDMTAYAAEKGLNKNTTAERYEELIKELNQDG
jgi:hypothetical protein